jgi:hypothetical protein
MPKKLPTPAEMKKAVEEFKKQFTGGFYHGSPSPNIKEFDPSKSTKDSIITTRGATFVSPNPRFAESFLADQGQYKIGSGATMYPVSVNLGKHFDPATPEGSEVIKQYLANKYQKENGTHGFDEVLNQKHEHYMDRLTDPVNNWKLLESPELMNHLQSTGHDTFSVTEGGVKNVGIFDPKNIRGKFAKYNPEDADSPDFMKAKGGAVEGYDLGGKVKAAAKFARHPHGQDPRVAQALEEYLKGNISQEERIRIMNQFLPMRQWKELPPNYSDDEIRNALTSNKQDRALAPVPTGMRVGNRLDIPAYTQKGVYVDTTHDAAGKPISYGRTGHLKDVEFSSSPDTFVRVGLGTKPQALTPMGAEIGMDKTPKALIKGIHQGTPDDEVRRMMEEMLQDPRYTQIGMDPRKHSQFYDKQTGMPVWAAEEKLQSGPLILAPKQGLETTSWDDPRLNLSDFEGKKYAPGGKVTAAKKLLEHARSVPFVHFSNKANLSYLEPQMYGTGIKGQEAARLKNAPDIRPRSYIYTDRPDVRPEQGLGSHKYSGVAEDMYPLHEDPAGYSAIAKIKAIDPYMMQFGREVIDQPTHLNELERLIKQAGYKGYANDDVGLLFHPTEVKKVSGPESFASGGAVGAGSLLDSVLGNSSNGLANDIPTGDYLAQLQADQQAKQAANPNYSSTGGTMGAGTAGASLGGLANGTLLPQQPLSSAFEPPDTSEQAYKGYQALFDPAPGATQDSYDVWKQKTTDEYSRLQTERAKYGIQGSPAMIDGTMGAGTMGAGTMGAGTIGGLAQMSSSSPVAGAAQNPFVNQIGETRTPTSQNPNTTPRTFGIPDITGLQKR